MQGGRLAEQARKNPPSCEYARPRFDELRSINVRFRSPPYMVADGSACTKGLTYLISVIVALPPGTSTLSPTLSPSTARASGET